MLRGVCPQEYGDELEEHVRSMLPAHQQQFDCLTRLKYNLEMNGDFLLHRYPEPKSLLFLTDAQLAESSIVMERTKELERDRKEYEDLKKADIEGISHKIACPKCEQVSMTADDPKQMRSGDEPPTSMYRCPCGFTLKCN